MGFFDQGYDRADAVVGPSHVLIAPIEEDVPADLSAIIALKADSNGLYVPQGDWDYLGLAADSQSYSVTHDSEEIEYEQPSGALFETVSGLVRQIVANMGSINQENLQLIENAPAPTAIAAGANKSAQSSQTFGSYSALTEYRVALIAQRKQSSVEVTEPGGNKRGGFVAHVLYRATLAAEDREIEYSKGEPTGVEVTFTGYPESGQPAGKEYGTHLIEAAGTIAAS